MFVKVIYKRGEPATGIYFLVSGCVKLFWEYRDSLSNPEKAVDNAESNVRERDAGDIFGELALFPALLGSRRPETVVATGWGMAHLLPVLDFTMLRSCTCNHTKLINLILSRLL